MFFLSFKLQSRMVIFSAFLIWIHRMESILFWRNYHIIFKRSGLQSLQGSRGTIVCLIFHFPFFVSFISGEAEIHNNPSFACVTAFNLRREKPAGPKQRHQMPISVRKTDVSPAEGDSQTTSSDKDIIALNSVPCMVSHINWENVACSEVRV